MSRVSDRRGWSGSAGRLEQQIERQARLMAAMTSHPMQSTLDVTRWLAAIYESDPGSRAHVERVAAASIRLGGELGLEGDGLGDLERAALLHDIGRFALLDPRADSSAILPGDGRQRLEQARVARDILSVVPWLEPAATLIDASFEWFDGSGYPQGLSARAIPLGARALAVADAADTLAVLCLALQHPLDMVRDELVRSAGTRFDPEVVAVWLQTSDADAHTLSVWGAALPTAH